MSAKKRMWVDTVIIPSSNKDEAEQVPEPNQNGKRLLRSHGTLNHIAVDDMQGVLRAYVDARGGWNKIR